MKAETVDVIFRRLGCDILRSDIRRVLRALEATPEYKALVADAERYRWYRLNRNSIWIDEAHRASDFDLTVDAARASHE